MSEKCAASLQFCVGATMTTYHSRQQYLHYTLDSYTIPRCQLLTPYYYQLAALLFNARDVDQQYRPSLDLIGSGFSWAVFKVIDSTSTFPAVHLHGLVHGLLSLFGSASGFEISEIVSSSDRKSEGTVLSYIGYIF